MCELPRSALCLSTDFRGQVAPCLRAAGGLRGGTPPSESPATDGPATMVVPAAALEQSLLALGSRESRKIKTGFPPSALSTESSLFWFPSQKYRPSRTGAFSSRFQLCPDVRVFRAPLSFPSLTAAVYSERSASLGDTVRVPPRASQVGAGSARSACLAGALC